MKLWIRDKIWNWLGLTDKIEEIQERNFYLENRVRELEDFFIKRVVSFARLRDEVTEWKKLVSHNGAAIVSLGESLSNRRQEIASLIERFQNLDNEEVIRALHLRIEELENKKKGSISFVPKGTLEGKS